MGQKVNPAGLRLGINKDWTAKWYAPSKDFSKSLENDMKIREFLAKKLKNAAVSSITIETKSPIPIALTPANKDFGADE